MHPITRCDRVDPSFEATAILRSAKCRRPPARVEVSRDPEALARRVGRLDNRSGRDQPRPVRDRPLRRVDPAPALPIARREPLPRRLPWERIHWFWGDERFVPWDDPDSNYGMVRAACSGGRPFLAGNIHGIVTSGTPREAAPRYEECLKSYYGSESPRSGRAAVRYPDPRAGAGRAYGLVDSRDERPRRAASMGGRGHWRAAGAAHYLTYPVLESSRHTAFLVAGADKRETLSRALAGDPALPAARLRPVGELIWFVDEAARPQP